MLLESNPHLRQHAAGRRAVRRRVAVVGGQAAHRRAARRVRHRLHRGRLSCVESQGHRLLPARAHHAAQACAGGRVRLDLQEGRGGRRRPGLGRPAGKQGPRGHHRGEDVGRTGHARAADHARGEPAHDRRLGGPPERRMAGASCSMPSTSSTATRRTRTMRWPACVRPARPVPTPSTSARRTAARCRTRWARSWPPWPPRCQASSWASTATTTPVAPWRTRWPPCVPAPPRCRAR